jgi:hypothetical protein
MIIWTVLLFISILLVTSTNNQEALVEELSPKINFINIQAGSPTITISFKSPTLETQTALTSFWVKMEVPFDTPSLGPPLWGSTAVCCDFATMVFAPTTEFYGGQSNGYSIIYVRLDGATFNKNTVFVLQLTPSKWLEKVGYTEYMKVSIVSENHSDAITYAYNFAFMNFYASDKASNSLIIQDDTVSPNRLKVNQVVDSFLIVQMGFSTAQRIIIQTVGDYKFAGNADTTCGVVADLAKGITAVSTTEVKCEFWENLGPIKKNYIVYTWLNGFVPPGKYKLKYQLQTPSFAGNNHLLVMTMARYFPFIYLRKEYSFIFAASIETWAAGFPKLFYSGNFNAANDKFIDQVGLYSMGLTYNKVFNTLRFIVRVDATIPLLSPGEKYTLSINTGSPTSVLPLGYLYEDLPLAPGFAQKNVTFANGVLTIDNIGFSLSTSYTVSFRVGYVSQGSLPTDSVNGLGLVILRKGTTTLLRGTALMRSRFNVVKYQPSLMTVEAVDRSDFYKRRHKGFSAFASELTASIASANNYRVTTGKYGLRYGDNQNLWFQSSMGPNPLYWIGSLVRSHNSKRVFIDVITDPSIQPMSSNLYIDSSASTYCDVYSSLYTEWASAFPRATCQSILAKYTLPVVVPTINSMAPTDTANFIGGCNIQALTAGSDSYSRLRMRLKDHQFTDTNSREDFIRGKDAVFFDSNQIKTTQGMQGNNFVWKNVKVTKKQSFKTKGVDAVVLDAYVLVYFASGTEVTTDEILVPPEIYSMDNMFVLTSDETIFPISSSIYASMQAHWMYDKDVSGVKWQLDVNPTTSWPTVLHMFGTFNNLPLNTKYLMIFFDFIDILVLDPATNEVGCSVKGVSVLSCKYGSGYNPLVEQVYQTVDGMAGYCYVQSRLNTYLLLELDATAPSNFAKDFSIVLPVKAASGNSVDKMATLYVNTLALNPSFIAADADWQTLEQMEFGVGAKSMKVDTSTHSTKYEIPTVLDTLEVNSANVRTLDDAIPNNNPANNVLWIDKALGDPNFIIGGSSTAQLRSICLGCTAFSDIIPLNVELFSSGLVCGNWNFALKPTFALNHNPLLVKQAPHVFKYRTTDKLTRYCLYVPSLISSPSNSDANVRLYNFIDFTAPEYSGIKWPADMISVVSNGRVLGFMKPLSLNREFSPNAVTFLPGDDVLTLTQTYNSAKVELNLQMTNPLPKGGVLFFGISAGCENLLTIYGEDSTPPCTIQVDLVKNDNSGRQMKCIYSINTGGFQIELQESLMMNGDLTMNNVKVIIYGLSIKKAIASTTCNFILRTYLSLSKNPLLNIDLSTNNLQVTYAPPVDALNPSGKLALTRFTSDINQVTAFSNVEYEISVTDRSILKTDFINLSLGAIKYDTADNPVWCSIRDPITNRYLIEFTRCSTANLGLLALKAYKDLSFSSFVVKINNVINPISSTPGAVAEYYINEGYQAFNSPLLNWSLLNNVEKFLNPVMVWTEMDVMGLKSDVFFSVVPDYDVQVSNVFYVYFSPYFSPSLSKYKVFVYLKYQTKDKRTITAYVEMKAAFIASRIMSITGWPSLIPAGSTITIQMVGIDNPVSTKTRVLQVILGLEKQYTTFRQWGFGTLGPAAPISNLKLINIESLVYNSLIIRESTKITVGFSVSVDIPSSSFVMVTINYLEEEMVKKFKPFCFLTKSNEFTDIAERCYFTGNRLEAKLKGKMEKDVSYIFIMDDIPNPDFGYKEPAPIIIYISSGDRKSVLSVSTEMIINYKKLPFVKRELNQLLDFVGTTNGVLEIPQGFYTTVDISPIVVNPLDSAFFLDDTTFALENQGNKYLVSKPLALLGVSNFIGKIGTSSCKLIVGCTRDAVLTIYPVQVSKKESSGKVYTELPLLRVKVISTQFALNGVPTVDVYITGKSIPIQLTSPMVPTSDVKFDILFLTTNVNGLVSVTNLQQQFSLRSDKPAFFLQIEAFSNLITPQVVPVTIRAVLSSSNFLDKVVNFNLIPVAVLPPLAVDFTLVATSPDLYKYSFLVKSTEPVFVYFYAMPTAIFAAQSKDTVRAWALNGLSVIEGDIFVGSIGIITLNVDQTVNLDPLISTTDYTLTVFYETTLSSTVHERTFTFRTKALPSTNGMMTLTFTGPVLFENRMKALCILAKKYSLSLENIYSGDGLLCNAEKMSTWAIEYHKSREKEPMTEAVKQSITKMDVIIFQSKRKGENSSGLTNIINASVLPGALNVFSLILNGVARLSEMTPIGAFFETVPSVTGFAETKTTSKTATVTGLKFTGIKGFLFAAAQKAEEFNDNISIQELRKLSSFKSFDYQYIRASPSDLSLSFMNLQPNTDYKFAAVLTSDDPRASAASATIVKGSFKTLLTDSSSNLFKFALCLFMLFAITLML